jgi:hypothetical protein
LQLANLPTPPESVPINMLVKVKGTPLADNDDVDAFDFIRTIAVARIMMPTSFVRLSAGREQMSEQTSMCFMAGANSIFYGCKLLTTPNPEEDKDVQLFRKLGLNPPHQTEVLTGITSSTAAAGAANLTPIPTSFTTRRRMTWQQRINTALEERRAADASRAGGENGCRPFSHPRQSAFAISPVTIISALSQHPPLFAPGSRVQNVWRGQRRLGPVSGYTTAHPGAGRRLADWLELSARAAVYLRLRPIRR